MRKRIEAANEFVENLITARNMDEQTGAVYQILSSSEVKGAKVSGEDTKAFLVHLAIDTFGRDYRSDIVLCSWGLLRGYERLQSVTERRIKFITESNFQGKKASLKTKNSVEGSRSLEDRSKDLIDLEKKLYTKIDEKYTNHVTDKRSFLQAAKQQYLVRMAGLNGCHQIKLPKPSYLRGEPMPMNNLPQRKPFIGRKDILGALEEAFASDLRIQLLVGMGGVGKTRIALEYAYVHANNYETIAWINAQNALTIHKSCIEFLERAESTAVSDNAGAIRERFVSFFDQSSDWLIVYDNVDYLDENSERAQMMKDLLEGYLPSSNGDILITTRCNRPFLGVDGICIEVFSPELAIRYLELYTKLKADDAANLLAKKLGYLPLALAYASAYIKANHINYQQYLDLWNREGMELFDEDIHETTVRKAFHISLDKLSEKEKGSEVILLFLHFCAVLAGDYIPIAFLSNDFNIRNDFDLFPTELNAILNSELKRNRILRKVSEYSLIDYIDDSRFSMHPLLREILMDELRHDIGNSDLQKYIEALRWKRIGYYLKSELAFAYYEGGDVEAAIRQMDSVLPEFLDMEQELLQLNGKVTVDRITEVISWKTAWSDTRLELDRIYWRTMDFADEELTAKIYDIRKKLMVAFYSVGLGKASAPEIYDLLFMIELSARKHSFDSESEAPVLLNHEVRDQGHVFAISAKEYATVQDGDDISARADKYRELLNGNKSENTIAQLVQLCVLFGTGAVPRAFLYAVKDKCSDSLTTLSHTSDIDTLISDAAKTGLLSFNGGIVYMDASLQRRIYSELPKALRTSWLSLLKCVFLFFVSNPDYQYIIDNVGVSRSVKKGGVIYFSVKDDRQITHFYCAELAGDWFPMP